MNYLNNRDLLREIHKSKASYCSFLEEDYANYDLILSSVDKINRNTIAEARRNRSDRLARLEWEKVVKTNPKVKIDEFRVDPKKIPNTDLVFRIMSFDHIPLEPGRKKTPKSKSDHHTKVNFPPFQHFKVNEQLEPYCVGKSHWVGGLENGYFSKDGGKMTNELAKMFIKLCERYGSRGNWRGYSYNSEMQAQALLQLSQVGLQFDESKSQNPFAYYTATVTNSFTRILNLEKRNQSIRDNILEMNNMTPSHSRQSEWGNSGSGRGSDE